LHHRWVLDDPAGPREGIARHAQGVEWSVWSNPRHPHPVPHLAPVVWLWSILRRYFKRPREAERRELVVPTCCCHRVRRGRHVLRTWPRAFARRAPFMSETIRETGTWKRMINIRPYLTHHFEVSNPGSSLTSLRFSFFVLLHLWLAPIIVLSVDLAFNYISPFYTWLGPSRC